MKSVKIFILKNPAAASIGLFALFFLLSEFEIDRWLMNFMNYQKASYLSGILIHGTLSVVIVLVIAALELTREAGFTPVSQWKNLWLIGPLLVYSALNGSEVIDGTFTINWADSGLMLLFTLYYISVGLIEEILVRGLVLPLMLRQWGKTKGGVYRAVLISSAIFGLAHLANLVLGRRDLLSTTAQITYGLFFGVFFAALVTRNKSIWPAIFCHFLFDWAGNFKAVTVGHVFTRVKPAITMEDALFTAAVFLPLLLIGLLYLRRVEPVESG
ncbi:MAG: CPBP family intramembrane metalloprotease [Chloroflexi bacterium]|nr:CPBP family intramembrane metalloprotease [Chloroflexota bacterium]